MGQHRRRTGEETFREGKRYEELDAKEHEKTELPTKIEKTDIKPGQIEAGGTEIVLQRHYRYIRDPEDPNTGSIAPEVAAGGRANAVDFFQSTLEQIPEGERDSVHVLLLASDTQYNDNGRRSYETGATVQDAAEEVFKENGLPRENVINTTGRLRSLEGKEGGPKPMPRLREPNFINESPEYFQFLLGKHDGQMDIPFWVDFENDTYKAEREAMGAEGPADIADRTTTTVEGLARYANRWHKANPGKRLIIWAASHYDTISPYVKREVFGVPNSEELMVDYGAGIRIDIDAKGKAKTEIAGENYEVSLTKGERKSSKS